MLPRAGDSSRNRCGLGNSSHHPSRDHVYDVCPASEHDHATQDGECARAHAAHSQEQDDHDRVRAHRSNAGGHE